MRFLIDLGDTGRKPPKKKFSVSRVVLTVAGLHIFVIGAIFVCEGIAHLNVPAELSHEDAMIIRKHFCEVTPPASVLTRILNVCWQLKQVFQVDPEYVFPSTPAPVRITSLSRTRTEIRVVTETNGIHVYDRTTKTWFVINDDEVPRLPEPAVDDDKPKRKTSRELCRELGVLKI